MCKVRPHSRLSSFEPLESRQLLALTAVGTPTLVNLAAAGDQLLGPAEAVSYASDGSILAVYSGRGAGDRDGVFLRRFTAQGAAIADPLLVNVTTDGVQHEATVAALPSGGFVVAWQGRGASDRQGVFARWYNASGTAVTGEVLVNETVGGVQSDVNVGIATDGTATFVWHGTGAGDLEGIFARRFSSASVAQGAELLVNTTTAREQAFADIAIAADNTAMIVWSSRHQDGSDWGVYAQRLTATGAKVAGELRVNTATSASQTAATVEALDAGFVVAWQSLNQDGAGWGVYGQQLSSTGAAVGSEFRINDAAAGQQRDVALAATNGSSVVAVWTDGKPDGAGWNVRGREVNLSASTPGFQNEFAVHPATASAAFGAQTAASVAVRGDAVLIAWFGDGLPDHDGAYLQRYSLNTSQEPNVAPNLAAIANTTAQTGVQKQITVTATDANAGDTLTFSLDPQKMPAGATIEKTSNGQAIIRWTPQSATPSPVLVRVIVSDSGVPSLSASQEFWITVNPPVIGPAS